MNNTQKLEIHPAVDRDIDHQFQWLRENNCGPATLHKFLDAIEEAKSKISTYPETWSKVSGSRKIRKVQIKQFRMTVFYTIRKNKMPLILEFAGAGLMPRWAERLRLESD